MDDSEDYDLPMVNSFGMKFFKESIFTKNNSSNPYTDPIFRAVAHNDPEILRTFLNSSYLPDEGYGSEKNDPETIVHLTRIHKATIKEFIADYMESAIEFSTPEVVELMLEHWDQLHVMQYISWSNVIRNPFGIQNVKKVIQKYSITCLNPNFTSEEGINRIIDQKMPECERRKILKEVLFEGLEKHKNEMKEYNENNQFTMSSPKITDHGSVQVTVVYSDN